MESGQARGRLSRTGRGCNRQRRLHRPCKFQRRRGWAPGWGRHKTCLGDTSNRSSIRFLIQLGNECLQSMNQEWSHARNCSLCHLGRLGSHQLDQLRRRCQLHTFKGLLHRHRGIRSLKDSHRRLFCRRESICRRRRPEAYWTQWHRNSRPGSIDKRTSLSCRCRIQWGMLALRCRPDLGSNLCQWGRTFQLHKVDTTCQRTSSRCLHRKGQARHCSRQSRIQV